MAPTLNLKGKEWFIESVGEDRIKGPYDAAATALEAAQAEVAEGARRGRSVGLSVRDNHGIARECKLINKPERATCFPCESLWLKELSSVTPRCPLWEAFSSFEEPDTA
jgi:hypothetical protein